MNSRDKGRRGEVELANKLKEYGYDARRGQQFAGIHGDADVIGLPNVHVEYKRVERLNIEDAMAQSERDASAVGDIPTVFHRKNGHKWLVTMKMEDWMEMYALSGVGDLKRCKRCGKILYDDVEFYCDECKGDLFG